MSAPVPPNEQDRLATLHKFRILDTEPSDAFDNLTELARTIFDVPISLVSLVDEDRQWFKSHNGVDITETPRDQAFCAHAILNDDVFVVEDATTDDRFLDNPMVTGAPAINFYAGAPLSVSNGMNLGTLCIIDNKPRQLTATESRILMQLRQAVVIVLEHHRALQDLEPLNRVVPMCAWCRNVKTQTPSGEEHWQSLEAYVAENAALTHGMCPDCHRRELEKFDARDPKH